MAPDTEAKKLDLSKWTTERLERRAAELAEKRTEVRLEQNALTDELNIRTAFSQLPESARKAIELRLGGEIPVAGGVGGDQEGTEE